MQEICRSSRLVAALVLCLARDQLGSIALLTSYSVPDAKHLSMVDKSVFTDNIVLCGTAWPHT